MWISRSAGVGLRHGRRNARRGRQTRIELFHRSNGCFGIGRDGNCAQFKPFPFGKLPAKRTGDLLSFHASEADRETANELRLDKLPSVLDFFGHVLGNRRHDLDARSGNSGVDHMPDGLISLVLPE